MKSKVNPNRGQGKPPKKEDLPANEKKEVEEAEERIETPEDQEKSEESKQLFIEASNLVLHLPNWVHAQHEIFYKVAYLQVKKDEKASRQPARIRTALIRNLMNRMITKMGKFYQEQREEKAKEKENATRRF